MCNLPSAYGGPSCKMKGFASLRNSKRFDKFYCLPRTFKISGSRLGKLPRIGNSVSGKCNVLP